MLIAFACLLAPSCPVVRFARHQRGAVVGFGQRCSMIEKIPMDTGRSVVSLAQRNVVAPAHNGTSRSGSCGNFYPLPLYDGT